MKVASVQDELHDGTTCGWTLLYSCSRDNLVDFIKIKVNDTSYLREEFLSRLRLLTVTAKSRDKINIAGNGVVSDNGVLVPIVVVVVPGPGTVHLESQSDSVVLTFRHSETGNQP